MYNTLVTKDSTPEGEDHIKMLQIENHRSGVMMEVSGDTPLSSGNQSGFSREAFRKTS